MKRTFRGVYTTLILAVSLFAFAACTSSDDSKETTPKELPSFTNLTVAAGDTGEITFNAYDVWKLSSNKIWFKLSANTGPGGNQTVTYTVTDDGQGFDTEEATLTFQIGTQTTTFKAVRSSKDRTIKFYSRIVGDNGNEYNEVTAIDLKFQANSSTYLANFAVVANFDWKVAVPEWISIEQDDMAGQANTGEDLDPSKLTYRWVRIDYSKATLEDMTGELVFSDRTADDKTTALAVTCPGSKSYMLHNALFELSLNSDGEYVPSVGNEPEEFYSFTVTAATEGVIFFKVAKEGDFYGVDNNGNFDYNAIWCRVSLNEDKQIGPSVNEFSYDLKAEPNSGTQRSATIVALPRSMVMDKNITDPKDLVASGDKELKPEYQQYIVTELTQSGGSKEIAFSGATPEGVTLEKLEAGSDDYDFIHGEYGVDMIYQMTFNSFSQMNMCTLDYNGYEENSDLIPMFNPSENENIGSRGWISMETNQGKYMAISITDDFVPFTGERYTWIIVKNDNTKMNEFAIKVIQKVAR